LNSGETFAVKYEARRALAKIRAAQGNLPEGVNVVLKATFESGEQLELPLGTIRSRSYGGSSSVYHGELGLLPVEVPASGRVSIQVEVTPTIYGQRGQTVVDGPYEF